MDNLVSRLTAGCSSISNTPHLSLIVTPPCSSPHVFRCISERTVPRHPTVSQPPAAAATGLLLACAVSHIANPCRPLGEQREPRRGKT